jgi:uncharacterized NAD(P)/FAD-binding protein YdhS
MTSPASVAIIGLGSRGLSVLERIVTHARLAAIPAHQLRVEIIDPACTGAGVHDLTQPDYLLLNTTCSQVSMFPDACTVGSQVSFTGPDLYTWVTGRGLRLGPDGYSAGDTGRPIRPTDFLPRRLLGEYLRWFLAQLSARAAGHVQLNLHTATAVDLSSAPDGGLVVGMSDGRSVTVRHAFLTTGYTPNAVRGGLPGSQRLITEPYPLPERLAAVAPGQQVAIGGFGLSAMDVISSLTVGRGGQFSDRRGQLRYQPSGCEPSLLLYSRTGVPCRARPRVVEFGPQYRPLAFTEAGIDAVRAARGEPLDFDADVLPLVLTEMRIAYRRSQARGAGSGAEQALDLRLGQAATLLAVLDELDARHGGFDPVSLLDGSAGMDLRGPSHYQQWLAAYLTADLAEAELGFTASPVKAALDVLRELRDTFRYAVDFGGISAASLEEFTRRTIPAVNRAVVGPQYERHAELLALIADGHARVPFGPAPQISWNEAAGRWRIASGRLTTAYCAEADWVIAAQVPLPAAGASASPLLRSLHGKGWIRPYQPGSALVRGIDVSPELHPLNSDGRPDQRIWVLGPLCEGATFYNNLVPSPNMHSRPVFDAHRCVAAMFSASQPGASRIRGRVQPIG